MAAALIEAEQAHAACTDLQATNPNPNPNPHPHPHPSPSLSPSTNVTPDQAECEAKLRSLSEVATAVEASGRAEIRGEASELPLRVLSRAAGGGSQRTDADCVLVSFRYHYISPISRHMLGTMLRPLPHARYHAKHPAICQVPHPGGGRGCRRRADLAEPDAGVVHPRSRRG